MVQFAHGLEPIAVYADGRVGPWLHARIDDVSALPEVWQNQLAEWLAKTGVEAGQPATVVVSHDGDGAYEVHVTGQSHPVEFKSMPAWLQASQPPPKPRKAKA